MKLPKLNTLAIFAAYAAVLCCTGCSNETGNISTVKEAVMPAASGTCPATPYTVAVHSLHGPVARVDTRVYDPSESNGDDRLISRDYKVYNRRGQLTAESITTDDYEGDTLRLDYDDNGRLVIDVDPR